MIIAMIETPRGTIKQELYADKTETENEQEATIVAESL